MAFSSLFKITPSSFLLVVYLRTTRERAAAWRGLPLLRVGRAVLWFFLRLPRDEVEDEAVNLGAGVRFLPALPHEAYIYYCVYSYANLIPW